MREITVNIKIKHVLTKTTLKQYFGIFSYNDFFLEDSFAFYRQLKVFLSKFYIDKAVITHISQGINQFEVHYDSSSVQSKPSDLDQFLTFSIPDKDERMCYTCEFYENENEYCSFYEEKRSKDKNSTIIKPIPDYCFYWSEKE